MDGRDCELTGPGLTSLAAALAEMRGGAGAISPCGEGVCGACSLLVDGELVAACITPLCQLAGARVLTFDGLLRERSAASVARTPRTVGLAGLALRLATFADRQGLFPCDLCRDGVLLAATVDLAAAAEGQTSQALASRVCRCTDLAELVDEVDRLKGGGA